MRRMKKLVLLWLGKIIASLSRVFHFGAGFTWPGHVAVELEPQIFSFLAKQLKEGIILVAGTNGKTTTTKIIDEILKQEKLETLRNESGANLLNGLVSALIQKADWFGKMKVDWAIFEVDEATLPLVVAKVKNQQLMIILLNLFRDQLDRYGELDTIVEKWQMALQELSPESTVVLNADDPHLAFLGQNLKCKIIYFGLDDPRLFLDRMEHAVDSVYCPTCGQKLAFAGVYFSHLGVWSCRSCGQKRPQPNLSNWTDWSNLEGIYNRYNVLASVSVAKTIGIKEEKIHRVLRGFRPAFGRQEEFTVEDKKIKILLAKNPAGFNESLRTLTAFPGRKKTVLLVLNDRVPDGRDVSWIWDVDYEMIPTDYQLIISGDRAYDLGLRIKYSREIKNEKRKMKNDKLKLKIIEELEAAVFEGLKMIEKGETLYILPTYSAMLEAREILSGRKIL